MKAYFIALFCALGFYWHGVEAADVTVSDAWVRATAPGQTVGGAYLKIRSAETAYLIGATSSAAKTIEVHQMSMENNVMKMRPLPRLELPAGTPVELKPGGYHLMMMGITRPLVKGGKVDLKLNIEDKAGRRQTVEVKAEVSDLGATKMH